MPVQNKGRLFRFWQARPKRFRESNLDARSAHTLGKGAMIAKTALGGQFTVRLKWAAPDAAADTRAQPANEH